jgi:hypothetical protein
MQIHDQSGAGELSEFQPFAGAGVVVQGLQ